MAKFITFGKPDITKAEIDEVVDTLKSGWIGLGSKTKQLEEDFKRYVRAGNAVAVNSATSALFLALKAEGIGPGDEVITTPMTFAATATAIEHVGAKPVFADVLLSDGNIDPAKIKARVTKRTKAILPVHLYGKPCDLPGIQDIALKHTPEPLKVIWDCAHATEAIYRSRTMAEFDSVSCFSFYVTKNMTTCQGGMVTTTDEELAEKIRLMSNHGMTRDAWLRYTESGFKPYDIVCLGYNHTMSDLNASIGLHQLKRIDENQKKRTKIWLRYDKEIGMANQHALNRDWLHAKHLYTIQLPIEDLSITRDQFIAEMQKKGVGCGIHYTALHLTTYFSQKYKYTRGDFPNAEHISDRTISLPLSPAMTEDEVTRVIDALKETYNAAKK
jgi:dTDP-4-amino-4,6-dideoxygalactose transaminase